MGTVTHGEPSGRGRDSNRRRGRWPVRAIAALGLVVVGLAGCSSGSSGAGHDRLLAPNVVLLPVADRPAFPTLAGPTVAGPELDTATLHGHVLVVNMWASWCGPCRGEEAALAAASRQLAGAGVRFVGLNVDDQRPAAAAELAEFRVGYPSLFDPSGALALHFNALGAVAPPFTVVVDPAGRVAVKVIGELPGSTAQQIALLERAAQAARG